MSVNIKENGDLTKVANNISIVQANWDDKDNTTKNTCIRNQPETLTSLEAITANTNENALAGANAVKELNDSLTKKAFGITWTQFWGVSGQAIINVNTHILSVQLTVPAISDIPANVETVVGQIDNNTDKPYNIYIVSSFITYTGKTGICIIKNDGSISILSTQVIPNGDLIYINMCW